MQRLLLSDTNGSISWIRPYTCENEKYENDDGKNTAQDRPMSYVAGTFVSIIRYLRSRYKRVAPLHV